MTDTRAEPVAGPVARRALATAVVDEILVVTIDRPGEPVNTLGPDLIGEFESVFQLVNEDSLIKAVVLTSGKPDGFIAGADIEQFTALRTAADAERLSRTGQ